MQKVFFVLARFLIGLLLLISGFEKVIQPWQNFAFIIQVYDVFPPYLEIIAAQVVPWLELIVGVFLILGLWLNLAIRMSQGLFFIFIFFVAQALWRNVSLEECGCFGQLVSLPPEQTLILDVLVFVVLTLMAKFKGAAAWLSFDRNLERAAVVHK